MGNIFELFAKIGLDKSEYDKGLDEAGGKLSGFGKKLKTGLATAAKVSVASIGAASAAVGALAKTSLDAYGEYEQLVGGVETLFKTSANVIMGYADNAYKTAGLSANEYMSTVTSFSASLLQSLGGDTQAAAEKADRAVTDMADNANKMGTSIDMIQNAYQGFAKQNFTMLDNLKLGYGGTKEEMERLLTDAEKLPEAIGRDFDISSYADVVDAIHLVQESMGIAGTTAKEAASTIQGSLSAAKSAWTNLVTGISDENANLDVLINNFVESVGTVAENIIPTVQTALSSIGKVVAGLAPQIAEALPQMVQTVLPSLLTAGADLVIGLATGITEALPGIIEAVAGVVPTIIASLEEAGPRLMESGGKLLTMVADGLLSGIETLANVGMEWGAKIGAGLEASIPDLLNKAVDYLFRLVTELVDNAPKFAEAGASIIEGIVNGLSEWLPTLIDWIPTAIISLANGFAENYPQIVEIGAKIMVTLAEALIKAIPQLLMAIPEIAGALLKAAVKIGGAIIEGAWNGFKEKIKWLVQKVKEGFSGVVDAIKNLLGIHSPSRVFAGIGGNMALGLEKGWDNEFSHIKRDIEGGMNFGTATMDFASSGLARSGQSISAGLASAAQQNGEVTIPLTLLLDGTVLARTMYKYNVQETQRRGSSYVMAGA